MPKYLIERDIPKVGVMSKQGLQAASRKSACVLENLGPKIQWQHSYVTDDKLYCVYIAANEELVRVHAQESEFPANRISEIKAIIDLTMAE